MTGRFGCAGLRRSARGTLGVFFLAVALSVACAGAARADLPAPAMMPNTPIMAGEQVILLWMPVPGAVKYNVYVDGKKAAEATGVQHMVPTPQEPGEHRMELSAVDAAGKEGAKSKPAIVTIISIEPPANLLTRFADGVLSVRWDRVKGAVIYNLYRAEKPDGEYTMLASLQTDTHTDSSVQRGKTYYYQVTAKDLAGKESKRSQTLTAAIPAQETAKVEHLKLNLKVVPSEELRKLVFIGRDKLSQVTDFKIGPDDFGYVVDSFDKRVRKFELKSGDVVKTFGKGGAEPGDFQSPTGLAVSGAGKVYVADTGGKIVVFDTEGVYIKEIRLEVPDPAKEKEIYENSTRRGKGGVPAPSGLAVDDANGVIYAAVPAYNTIYAFSLDGAFKGFIGRGGNAKENLALPTELILAQQGKQLFITQPPAHEVRVYDVGSKKQVGLIGEKKTGFIGGFIGVNGATLTPKNDFLLCDSGIHSIQVFSGDSFDYLYHVGGAVPMADPEYPDRAKFDFNFAIKANFDKGGDLYVLNGMENYISVRKVLWDKVKEVQ